MHQLYLTHYKYIDWLEKLKKMAEHPLAFFGLSCDVDPVYIKDYKNNLKCGHIEKEFQSLAMMANTCSLCMEGLWK